MKNNLALLLQLYSLDRINELEQLIDRHNNIAIDLSVGEKNKNNPILAKFINKFKHKILNVTFHKNYGVDIAPFLQQICNLDPYEFPYFIKLHSKQSFFGPDLRIDWGSILIDVFIGNEFNYINNLRILKQQHIGMIANRYFTLSDNIGPNLHKINTLLQTLCIDNPKLISKPFAAGSMFMSKTAIFQKYFKDKLDYLDVLLSNEIGKVNDAQSPNGTYSHALERIFGYIIHHENLKIHNSVSKEYIIYNEIYKKLHLNITYNDLCYLTEDISICGTIIKNNEDRLCIKWGHLDQEDATEYIKLNNNKLIRA